MGVDSCSHHGGRGVRDPDPLPLQRPLLLPFLVSPHSGSTRCALCTSGLLRRSSHWILPCWTLCLISQRPLITVRFLVCPMSSFLSGCFLPGGAAAQSRNWPGCSHSPGQPLSLQGQEAPSVDKPRVSAYCCLSSGHLLSRGALSPHPAGVTATRRSAQQHSVRVPLDSSALASEHPPVMCSRGVRSHSNPRSYCDRVKGRFPKWLPPSSPPSPCPPPRGVVGGPLRPLKLRHPRARGACLSGEHRGRGPGGSHPAPRLQSTDPALSAPSEGPDRDLPGGARLNDKVIVASALRAGAACRAAPGNWPGLASLFCGFFSLLMSVFCC